MANILSVIESVTGVLPLIQTIITGVESLFGSGNGPQKLTAATGAAIAALQTYAALSGKTLPATLQADIQTAISANVKVMNDLGLLLPQQSPAPPAAN
jgi:hypothetical protein